MSDEPEEKNPWAVAREAIDDALRTFLESAQGDDTEPRPMFLTSWTVVACGYVAGEDGRSSSAYNRLSRDDQAPHVTLGLLEYELAHYKADLTRPDDT